MLAAMGILGELGILNIFLALKLWSVDLDEL